MSTVTHDDPPPALPGETVDQYVARTSRATRPARKANSKKQDQKRLIHALADVLNAAADGEDAVEVAYSKFREIKDELSTDARVRVYSLLVPTLIDWIATASARRHALEKRVAALEQRLAQGGPS